ncbi:MAG: hypothetical protein F4180_09415 [Chloroflexi bacterium]|nr:hypothetical protein [Chloroflexota bacterium]
MITATDTASAHLSNAPITVTLSTGAKVDIYPTSLSVLSDITAQEDAALLALSQHRALQKIADDPGERMWEKRRRAAYFSDRYIREIGRLCEMIASATHPPPRGFFGHWRAFLGARRARRALRRSTHHDWTAVISAWRQLNDIDAVLGQIFGEKYTPLRDREDPSPAPQKDARTDPKPTPRPPRHAPTYAKKKT